MDKSIKYYRNKLGIKQLEMAKTLGITATDMPFYEICLIIPTLKKILVKKIGIKYKN